MSEKDSLRNFAKSLADELAKVVKDVTTLTVVTVKGVNEEVKKQSTGETIYVIRETGVVAKTIIELDGDIILQVPVKSAGGEASTLDERLLELHKANVELALENWRTFMTTLIEIAGKLFTMLGL
ncbi:MAG TPA: hypothetical protein ENG65_03175 [Candidatus Bathyarchaeota archaeon]|nr:hypothetical protein [Candidatus Bathyarchaeota archaeon]